MFPIRSTLRTVLSLSIVALLVSPVVAAAMVDARGPAQDARAAVQSPCAFIGTCTAWNSENDGAGSGLDADLLDGNDSAFFIGEIEAAADALRDLIDAETAARIAGISAVESALDAGLAQLDAEIRADMDAGLAALSDSLSGLADELAAETAARQAAVAGEAQLRADGDAALASHLDSEIARIDAQLDTILATVQAHLDAFATQLAAEAAARQAAIAAEAAAREAGDADLVDLIALSVASLDAALRGFVAAELSVIHNDLVQLIASESAALHAAINGEAQARAAGDAVLSQGLADESAARSAAIDAEEQARAAGDAALLQGLADEAAARTAAIHAALGQGNPEETAARIAADEALAQSIADETAARSAAIATEAQTRAAGDQMLADAFLGVQALVFNEQAARQSAIAALQSALNSEVAARTNADNALQNSIASESAARASALSALSSRTTSLESFVNNGQFQGTSASLSSVSASGTGTFGSRVGVGTTTPDTLYALDVRGKIRSTDDVMITGDYNSGFYVGDTNWGLDVVSAGGNTFHTQVKGFGQAGAQREFRVVDAATGQPRLRVDFATGGVGIGTAPDSFFELDVAGDIRGTKLWSTNGADVAGTSILRGRAELKNTLQVDGNVGIGKAPGVHTLEVQGDIWATGHIFAHSGQHVGDVAEPVVGLDLAPGDVVVMDGWTAAGKLRVKKADAAFSKEVVGVVSTNPSLTLAGLATDTPLAVTGIVPVKVKGAIARGDLLATSGEAGVAMACADAAACYGKTFAKALEAYDGTGVGSIRVLVAVS